MLREFLESQCSDQGILGVTDQLQKLALLISDSTSAENNTGKWKVSRGGADVQAGYSYLQVFC